MLLTLRERRQSLQLRLQMLDVRLNTLDNHVYIVHVRVRDMARRLGVVQAARTVVHALRETARHLVVVLTVIHLKL
jgi:hypothetical protein